MPLSGSWRTAGKCNGRFAWTGATHELCWTQARGAFLKHCSLAGAGQVSVVGILVCLVLSFSLLLSFLKERNMVGDSKLFPFLTFLYLRALTDCLVWSWFATGPRKWKLKIQIEQSLDLKRQWHNGTKPTDQGSGLVPTGQDFVNKLPECRSRQGTSAFRAVPLSQSSHLVMVLIADLGEHSDFP